MNELKKFYEEAMGNQEMKDELVAMNEKAREMEPQETKKEIIKIAQKYGYDISEDDFKELEGERKEGELQEDDLAGVAGGKISAGCFITNAGCTVLGEIDSKGGCILLGLYN